MKKSLQYHNQAEAERATGIVFTASSDGANMIGVYEDDKIVAHLYKTFTTAFSPSVIVRYIHKD